MKMMTITQWVVIGSVVVLIVYDGVAVLLWGVSATISATLLTAAYQFPLIPLAFGLLMGHLFWPNPTGNKARPVDRSSKE